MLIFCNIFLCNLSKLPSLKFIIEGYENTNLIMCNFLQSSSELSYLGGCKWSLLIFLSTENLYEYFFLVCRFYYADIIFFAVLGVQWVFPQILAWFCLIFSYHCIFSLPYNSASVLLTSRSQINYTYPCIYQEHENGLNFEKWLFY